MLVNRREAHQQNILGGNLKPGDVIERFISLIAQQANKMKVLNCILPYALSISRAEIGALFVAKNVGDAPTPGNKTQEENNLTLIAQHDMPDELIQILIGEGFGQQLTQGEQVWVGAAALQLKVVQNLLQRHKLRGLFGLPLQFSGHVLGAIVVGTQQVNSALFDTKARQQLSTLAQLVSLYLDHIRLRANQRPVTPASQAKPYFEDDVDPDQEDDGELVQLLAAMMEAEEQMSDLNQDLDFLSMFSSEIGSSLRLNQVLEGAITQTMRALEADAGWCYFFEDGLLNLVEQVGLSKAYITGMQQLQTGDGAEGMAFKHQRPILRDAQLFHHEQSRRDLIRDEGLRTIAAVPLSRDEQPLGILAVGSRQDRNWSPRDAHLLKSISQRVSQAAFNAQRYADTESSMQTLKAKYRALQESNNQQVAELALLKQQTRQILRLQEQAWTDRKLLSSQNSKPRSDTITWFDEQTVTSLKQALGITEDELE